MTIAQSIEKPYIYTFYVLVKFFVDEWRAVLVMTVFQTIIIAGLVCGFALVTGHTPLIIPKLMLVVGTLVVYAITQYVFVSKHRWLRYKGEFDQFSMTKSNIASAAVWSGLVLAVFGGISLIKTVVR